ncbi:hypothetical protein LB450_08645 [Psychroflexus sp. CAK1W]|uniref:hypothetical protein n=1 Tax=Psychroflexus curvus TaxID=2873595 RepID=UPI001CCBFB42|nr:hypothetical protein [Psychroflexus curvus]MBZ9628164.1 hypothetical protein [Psychroflexus curvus]
MKTFEDDIKAIAKQLRGEPIYDGVVHLTSYVQAPVKILWILKDVSHLEKWEAFDLREHLRKIHTSFLIRQGFKDFFSDINRVSYPVLNDLYTLDKHIPNPASDYANALRHMACICIKKVSDGHRTEDPDYYKYYKEYKGLIQKQIHELNPDVIIFNDTFKYFEDDLHLNQLNAFGPFAATARARKIYIKIPKYRLKRIEPAGINQILKAYHAFKRQVLVQSSVRYSNSFFLEDIHLLRSRFEAVQSDIDSIKTRLMTDKQYEKLGEVIELEKGLMPLLSKSERIMERYTEVENEME